MFRLLEKDFICFVIAYIPEADICENYNPTSIAGECVDPNCAKFHVCTFHVKSVCRMQHCALPHTYDDAHNMKVKEKLHLSSYTDSGINKILRNKYPKICMTYGCDTIEDCPYLHICSKFCFGKCAHGLKCRFGHSFRTEHNAWILKAYGISEDEIWSGSPIARGLTIAKRIL
ncbi:hypothetical protein FSP39_009289 [Pinctada imbricata]|uniref:C3H1-type domain-containing protein n=1 Tax=Pinctada imbricata TaxID=66713 RepID=A0AA88YH40_PINIB|nr:hypothetical protein FSP39_009289 [Pinctada imbricata]